MPTKHIISPGLGFSPGSVKYIVTRGLLPADQGIIIPFDLDVVRTTGFDFDVARTAGFDLDVKRTITFDLEIG